MILIIGGAYQGKLEYAKKTYGIAESDVSNAYVNGRADFSKRCIYHFEKYLEALFKDDPSSFYEKAGAAAFRDDAVIIADDIFCGLVPMDKNDRAFREHCGRALTALADRCDSVIRVFCGLGKRLK